MRYDQHILGSIIWVKYYRCISDCISDDIHCCHLSVCREGHGLFAEGLGEHTVGVGIESGGARDTGGRLCLCLHGVGNVDIE